MSRYTHIVLRRMPPLNGFSIKTPEAKFLSDIRPRGIVTELNRMADRIKQLEDRIHRASIAFFEDGSDASVASGMLAILEEERNKR